MGWRITLEWSSKSKDTRMQCWREQQKEIKTKRGTVTQRGEQKEREYLF